MTIGEHGTVALKRIAQSLLLMVGLVLSGCDKKYEAPVPDLAWSVYDSPFAKRMKSQSRTAMEGVYKVTQGADQFGELVALKWSFVRNNQDTTYYLSMFCGKDISYFICQGKQIDNSFVFEGFWRKMTNVETGVARFTISPENGGNELVSGSPQIGNGGIVLDGRWGNDSQTPDNTVLLTYVRPLNEGPRPFEILGHRGGGRTSDHLPVSENSLGMIRYAARLGSTGVEIDVRITSDGVPILYHDNTLNLRLISKNGLVGPIENYSFQQLNTFVRLLDGETIPTLRAALDVVLYSTNLKFVWLDTKYAGPLDTVQLIQKQYLQKAQSIGRDLDIVIGLPGEDQLNEFLALPDYQTTPALCELSIDDVHRTNAAVWGPRWTEGVQTSEVAQIQAEGRRAFVWTLDDPPYVEQFVNTGNFDGILTNYPSIVAYYHYVKE